MMDFPLLIMNVQIFSVNMEARYLTSKEAILREGKELIIKIPLCAAKAMNGGPVIGQHYFVKYRDGIGGDFYPPEFQYIGTTNEQLVFSSVAG